MRLAEGFGCEGPVTLQFRSPPGRRDAEQRFVAMEMNARMGGGLPLSIAAGADWPGWILDLCAGKAPALDVPIRDGLLLLRYDASVFVPTVAAPRSATGRLDAKVVIFDLDDTLYPERDFVYGGYRAVAERVHADHGVDIEAELRAQFERGVRHDVFGLALRALGIRADETYLRTLVETYRTHTPALRPYVGIALLERLRAAGYGLGLVTDGITAVQRSKVASLGIEGLFDAIVYSHELGGRDTWKPSPLPYERCLAALQVEAHEAVYVADNPAKDFRGARRLGIATVRIRHPGGEHAAIEPATVFDAPDREIRSLTELAQLIRL
jgi:putative hydrolase of the HAD superfamily